MKRIFALILFFSCIVVFAKETLLMHANDNQYILSRALGMNAHLNFDCSRKFANELSASMKDIGVKMVRLDVYWKENDWLKQKKLLDRSAYYADKHGLQILLSIPQIPEKRDSAYLKGWLEMLKFYVQRYDGSTPIIIDGETEARYVRIDFFEPMNEPDLNMKKKNLDVPIVFKMMQMAYQTIKQVRKDAFVVMPGLTNSNDYTKKLLNYETSDGLKMSDIVDVTNVHFYFDKQKKYSKFLDDWISLLEKTGLSQKKHWVTECGTSLWEFSQEEQAKLLPKQNIIVLSKHFEKVFYYQFHAFGGNRGQGVYHQRQNYYGIVDPSISNSYGSFFVNDGVFKTAITSGDASKRVYLRKTNSDSFLLYSHSKRTLTHLKTSGLAIGGQGFTMKSVRLIHKDHSEDVLWEGNLNVGDEGSQVLRLPASKFLLMSPSDKICVNVEDVANLNENWSGLRPWSAYHAYEVLAKFLTEKSTIPVAQKTSIPKLNVYTWKTPDKGAVWAIWASEKESIKLKLVSDDGNINVVDYMGNNVSMFENTIKITDSMLYIFGTNHLKILHI